MREADARAESRKHPSNRAYLVTATLPAPIAEVFSSVLEGEIRL
jgi:hypothetical protein